MIVLSVRVKNCSSIMSDEIENDVKFPDINQQRQETGGASSTQKSHPMQRNDSFHSNRNKSQPAMGSKSAFVAKKERVE